MFQQANSLSMISMQDSKMIGVVGEQSHREIIGQAMRKNKIL